nr:MBL fold metallo-hydrolase [uncultured Dethiosulfovibrio sp.]
MNTLTDLPEKGLIFLGTAGTRFNVINQRRASGGMIASIKGVHIAIDPGPGALVAMCSLRPMVDPNVIQAILLTHRHIDHSGDANILAEAMTGGGKRPGGVLALPSDAIDYEPVVYGYLQRRIETIHRWETDQPISIGGTQITPLRLRHHGVECYGLRFHDPDDYDQDWGIISDTAFIPEIIPFFTGCKTMVINTTLLEKVDHIEHLSVPDVAKLIEELSPERLFMTHLGSRILEGSPEDLAKELSKGDTEVKAATDGMVVNLRGVK